MQQRSAGPLLVALLALLVLAPAASAARLPGAPRCPVFPRDNAWNQRVDRLAVAPDSARVVASIGLEQGLHADFGSGRYEGRPIGIPFDVVSRRTHRSRVRFDYADESNRVRYPIPRGVHIEGGAGADGDRHALLVDRDACKLYELFALARQRSGWTAGSGATWSLRSNKLRPRGWTSADAAGLPILPGLARYDEVRRGRIDHALRFTVSRTRNAFVFPARHFASSLSDPALPRMGERLRLRRDFNLSKLPRQARIVARALKQYGMLVADNGSDWYIGGAPNSGWNNDALHQLGGIHGADFEVVRTG
jgi:hypothetical protein